MVLIVESIKQGFWWGVGNIAALLIAAPIMLYVYERYVRNWIEKAHKKVNGVMK